MPVAKLLRACLLAILLLVGAACRQEQQPAASESELKTEELGMDLTASDLLVGDTTLTLRVLDKHGNPLDEPGILTLRGVMNHAGMTPVLAESDSAVGGVYNVPFEWTMGGNWTVIASLDFTHAGFIGGQFYFDIQSPTEDHDMADHADEADAAGANSAAYMQITNRGNDDIVLASALSAAAVAVEFHETRVVDGVASMTRLDELVVPGNGEIELAPGGTHLMLMNLTADLQLGDNFVLELTDRAGQLYRIEFRVSEPPSSDLVDGVTLGDLVFKNRWARPASAG